MTMFNLPHPGEALREDVLPEIKMSVMALAKHLGYSRVLLSNVIHCRAPISADMAVRLERAGLGKARMWVARQSAYDLWQAEHKDNIPAISRVAQAA
ncbi:HigA family addiction module antidote protein [Pseudomonas sp. CFBP 13711]|uniref:HigA family addiction module antitoxin n=1 Tax=unclassified Pseudomonas TaxID=196821 RepID=UPI00177BF09F|nr:MULTISPECIES: HigA family addiction module antitoxin [unclassified Pseudomonas]MBD8710207.1 HigA family addiction module antidote protein [Pseudomonas sp. CFBP 13711]MBD8715495.1 HigA family addiction module antidote protein [Pseudomonas sp. CFBP 13715]